MIKVDLNGTWQMKAVGADAWLSAQVPGSVASEYLRAGLIKDPYYRDQQYEVFDMFRRDYEYEREFVLDTAAMQSDCLELVCEGLDTIAELSLNGEKFAQTKNMHRTYRFDLKPFAREGLNRLSIVFRSPVEYVEAKQKESYLWAANGDYVVQGYPHLRKAHYMFGWDWGPKVPDSGIWRDIYIAAYQAGRLADVAITQDHTESGVVALEVVVQLQQFQSVGFALEAQLVSPEGNTVVTERVPALAAETSMRLEVKDPELWWPNVLGKQPLYELRVALIEEEGSTSKLDERKYKVGLRTLSVKREPDQWGESFEFVVNGISIFTMGANYIPEDNILDRHSRARTEQVIRDCVKANFNCIRVWGGGFYPDDFFYDLCDEYGLIVWQDHLFACAEYEMTPEFTQEILAEVADNVRRIRHHASLGMWCGNNEMEQAWIDWDFPKRERLKTDYVKQFEILIPEVSQAHDSNTFYWKASPSSGGGFDDPNASDRGDVHFWEVWHGGKPFTEYRKHFFRFCSEFGFQSFPSFKTVKQFTAPSDRNIFSSVMESHQKNAGGNGKILYGISENFLYPHNFDSLLYVSQLLQAEAMRYGVEHWRRHRGQCMGSVYWQLNDCWPVASWSSLDYYGRWKAMHYAAKRFYAPVLLSCEEEGTRVKLVATNDTLQSVSGQLEWRLRDTGSSILLSGTMDVTVESMSAQTCFERDFAEGIQNQLQDVYFEYEILVNGVPVSDGYALFVKPKHLNLLQEPNLKVDISEEQDRYLLDVRAEALALFVELDFLELDARFSDNYFHLSAGAVKRIELLKEDLSGAATLTMLQEQVTLRSLVDSYEL